MKEKEWWIGSCSYHATITTSLVTNNTSTVQVER
jgi:hypothetical protein